jgi:hypothetical protein
MREYCRACRDNDRTTVAEFIIWGKLFPPQALGPRCWNHAAPWFDISRIEQYAVYDLRPVYVAMVGQEQADKADAP